MKYIAFIICFLISFLPLTAQIKLPKLISDGVVLQRNSHVKLWGWGEKNETIYFNFNKNTDKVQVNNKGKWEITLPPQQAGGPYSMTFKTSNDTVFIKDVRFGDVWLCSGQSNMETTMERVSPLYPNEIENSANENIRQFLVVDDYNFKRPLENIKEGKWSAANPDNLPEFSALAYFFARKIYKETKVPIGLINSAVGGSPIEAWMNEESLKSFPDLYEEHLKYQSDSLINAIEKESQKNSERWNEELTESDKGLKGDYTHLTEFTDWESTEIPGYWKENKMLDSAGVIWYKKEVELSRTPSSKEAELNLGRLIDSDQAYVNGELVGQTGYQYPPRRYSFDADLLKKGKNVITVRLVNNSGLAGFVPDKPYFLKLDKDSINLEGVWEYKVGTGMPNMKGQPFVRGKPGGLYNAMIAPLHNFKIKGILWYQGESNAGNPDMYKKLFPEMIESWRSKWNNKELPFLYVQLPNFMKAVENPKESNWAEMREIQRNLKYRVQNTGMAVTIDLGEWNDIHPLNKKDVGERLVLQARKIAYKEHINADSPQPKTCKLIKKGIVKIIFKHTFEGLKTNNLQSPKEFALSEDGITYYWAEAKIVDKKTVQLSNSKIKNPKYVRYAWADNPDKANLYNSIDLPVSPFQEVIIN